MVLVSRGTRGDSCSYRDGLLWPWVPTRGPVAMGALLARLSALSVTLQDPIRKSRGPAGKAAPGDILLLCLVGGSKEIQGHFSQRPWAHGIGRGPGGCLHLALLFVP